MPTAALRDEINYGYHSMFIKPVETEYVDDTDVPFKYMSI